MTFKQYYEVHYGAKIHFSNQPLVSAIAKTEKKIGKSQKITREVQKIYLIPELVSLTGLDQSQRQNFPLMQQIAELTRLTPQTRLNHAANLAKVLREQKSVSAGNPVYMNGSKLYPPLFRRDSVHFKTHPSATEQKQLFEGVSAQAISQQELVLFHSERTSTSNALKIYETLFAASSTYKITLGNMLALRHFRVHSNNITES